MRVEHAAKSRRALVLAATVGLGAVLLASPATAAPEAAVQAATVVTAVSTKAYGSVLVVGGSVKSNELAGYPIFEFSGDGRGKLGCGTKRALGFDAGADADVPLTCTGPESDMPNNVATDDWPALTTTGAPIAGRDVNPKLLGTVYRPGIGHQVTYGGHPLYLFVPPRAFVLVEGEDNMETVEPLPPWHGFWFLVSSKAGQPAPGVATIEVGTLPNGKKVVAAEMDPRAGGVAVTVYSYSRDHSGSSACSGACAITWVPVLTTGRPQVAAGIASKDVAVIRRPDGTDQVTYEGKPLYLYSAEKGIFPFRGGPPQVSGTAGNGNGLAGPAGGKFSLIYAG
jgi:predicted lipoprotein with Yx(FWY)xxD motif